MNGSGGAAAAAGWEGGRQVLRTPFPGRGVLFHTIHPGAPAAAGWAECDPLCAGLIMRAVAWGGAGDDGVRNLSFIPHRRVPPAHRQWRHSWAVIT